MNLDDTKDENKKEEVEEEELPEWDKKNKLGEIKIINKIKIKYNPKEDGIVFKIL
jgi:hypothetical protein